MGVVAFTAWEKVGVGTSLVIAESPQEEGVAPIKLVEGMDLSIEHTNSDSKAKVIEVSRQGAIIQREDGSKFRMTPREPEDVDDFCKTSLVHTDWVVRESVE